MNKTDMARVIVQALYNLKQLPPANNIHVKRMVRKSCLDVICRNYYVADGILNGKR